MIGEGEYAPKFELPAVINGDFEEVSLEDYLGDSVIILAFYPADFNPSCTGQSTGLDGFDVFSMQQDAIVLGICGDSVYSHHEFAQQYNLHLPLLADVNRKVADAYGVPLGDGGYATGRGVVVVDFDGRVVYSWAADHLEDLPNIDEIQKAFKLVGDADAAEAQYREGCDWFDEGRDTFMEGMEAYENREWVLANSSFKRAIGQLTDAYEAYERAIGFSDDEDYEKSFEFALQITDDLTRAIKLFSDAAGQHANRNVERAEDYQEKATRILEEVQELGAPPEPEELPADVDYEEITGEGTELASVSDSTPTSPQQDEVEGSLELAEPVDDEDDEDEEDDEDLEDDELEALTAEIQEHDDGGDDDAGMI